MYIYIHTYIHYVYIYLRVCVKKHTYLQIYYILFNLFQLTDILINAGDTY